MKIIQILNIAIQNLKINKRRSVLTMLGLIIGISAVVLVLSVGAGAKSLITGAVKTQGTNQIVVLAGSSDSNGPPAAALGISITTLTEEDRDAMLEKSNVSHVSAAAGYVSGNKLLQWKNVKRNITFTGTNASYKEIEKVFLEKGKFFSEISNKQRERVLVLGDEIATEIFGSRDPIGEEVKIDKKKFKIIGVLQPKNSSIFSSTDSSVIMPLQTAQYDILGIRHISSIRALVDDEKYLFSTTEEIRNTIFERHNKTEDFSIRKTADLLNILETVTSALTYFLVGIAGISLFVGGVGIMNIMLIGVQEKTREIGLRKAVGAKEQDILLQFLIETILLAIIGGIVGISIGVALSYSIFIIVHQLGYEQYQFIVTPIAIIMPFIIATVIGTIFGVYPAQKAAQLSPMDALRYE